MNIVVRFLHLNKNETFSAFFFLPSLAPYLQFDFNLVDNIHHGHG